MLPIARLTKDVTPSTSVSHLNESLDPDGPSADPLLVFERDATVTPGPGCTNPPSLTYIKCSIFGAVLDTTALKNVGQYQDTFHVVIAGSNTYVATAPANQPGFLGPRSLGNATVNSACGYMGVQTFPQSQPYDPSVCAAACDKKSAFDIAQGLPSKANPDICNFFVAYYLYKNGQNGVFTCTYYTASWSSKYVTNFGQYKGQDHYTIGYSNAYSKSSALTDQCPTPAPAQKCISGSYKIRVNDMSNPTATLFVSDTYDLYSNEYTETASASAALIVNFPTPICTSNSTQLDLVASNPAQRGYPYFGAVVGVASDDDNFGSGNPK